MDKHIKELASLIRREKNAKMRIKLLALQHFIEGQSRSQIADYLKVSRTSVNKWVSVYLSHGIAGLADKRRSGRRPALSSEQQRQLADYIVRCQSHCDGHSVTGQAIQAYIARSFGIDYEISTVYRILNKISVS